MLHVFVGDIFMLSFGDNEMKSDSADILQVDANNFQFGFYMYKYRTSLQATMRADTQISIEEQPQFPLYRGFFLSSGKRVNLFSQSEYSTEFQVQLREQ